MANEYYTPSGSPTTNSDGASAVMRAEFASIQTGLDKLPVLTANGDKAVFVNAGGTALTAVTAATALTKLGAQPADVTLTSLAALGTTADRVAYTTGVDTWAETPLTAAGRALIDDASNAAQRTTLGATATGDAVFTAATAAAARTTLGSTATGDAVFTAATQAAARSAIGAASANVTFNVPHTWAVAGEVKVPAGDADVIPGFFVPTLATGQTIKLVEARHKLGSGTSATVKLQKNGVDITGFTGISVTTTATLTNPADVTLAAGDYIQPVVVGVSGTPQNMSFTIALEYVQAGA